MKNVLTQPTREQSEKEMEKKLKDLLLKASMYHVCQMQKDEKSEKKNKTL